MKSVIAEVLALLGGGLLLFLLGKRNERQEAKIKDIQSKAETLERINNVETNTSLPDALGRLRKGGHLRD